MHDDADHTMMMPKPEVMLMQQEREAECIARQARPLSS